MINISFTFEGMLIYLPWRKHSYWSFIYIMRQHMLRRFYNDCQFLSIYVRFNNDSHCLNFIYFYFWLFIYTFANAMPYCANALVLNDCCCLDCLQRFFLRMLWYWVQRAMPCHMVWPLQAICICMRCLSALWNALYVEKCFLSILKNKILI